MKVLPPPFAAQSVIQRTNQPWSRDAAGRYGRKSRLTFSEAVGVTGGTQTTNLDASLNGKFFGKFVNVAHHMGGTDGTQLLANGYPAAICSDWGVDKPHAEDFLLVALETEWNACGNNWLQRYPYQGGKQQQKSLLSLRMNRSPCPRCAKNLHRYCRARNLSLRVKATFMHPDTDAKGRTGTSLLDSKNRPVRQWDTDRLLAKTPKGAPGDIDTWSGSQAGKAGNPYRYFGRDIIEAGESGRFNAQRTTYNIPLLTGWSAANNNVSRATIQNKARTSIFPLPMVSPNGATPLRKLTGPAPVPSANHPARLSVQRYVPPACPPPPYLQPRLNISGPSPQLGLADRAKPGSQGLPLHRPAPFPR